MKRRRSFQFWFQGTSVELLWKPLPSPLLSLGLWMRINCGTQFLIPVNNLNMNQLSSFTECKIFDTQRFATKTSITKKKFYFFILGTASFKFWIFELFSLCRRTNNWQDDIHTQIVKHLRAWKMGKIIIEEVFVPANSLLDPPFSLFLIHLSSMFGHFHRKFFKNIRMINTFWNRLYVRSPFSMLFSFIRQTDLNRRFQKTDEQNSFNLIPKYSSSPPPLINLQETYVVQHSWRVLLNHSLPTFLKCSTNY